MEIEVIKRDDKKQFHTNFKLQGVSFKIVEELLEFSKSVSIEVYSFLNNWFNANLFVEVKTSGSTGDPKIIKLQKKYMINSAIATGTFFNLNENTTALLCMSANYIAGKMMLVRALELGWHLDVVEVTSNPLKNIGKVFDFCAMVPLQLANSLTEIHTIKKLIVGGGVVSNELFQKLQHIKTEVFATYGMTETITHIAVKKLNNYNKAIEWSRGDKNYKDTNTVKKKSSTPFSTQYYSEMKSEAAHYITLPSIRLTQNSKNCLVIEAPNIASKIITTNDLVELISENEFKWLGRFDSIINSGGIKLIPEQIEKKLSGIITNRFFVAGIQDSVLGEKLILIVEGNKNDVILDRVKNLKTLLKYEVPKEIYFLKSFAETPTKKINRQKTISLLNEY